MTIRMVVRGVMTAATMVWLVGVPHEPARSAEPASKEPEQSKFSAWVSKAQEAAKKAAHEASIAAKEAEKASKRAGVEVSNAAARAARAAATKAAEEATARRRWRRRPPTT